MAIGSCSPSALLNPILNLDTPRRCGLIALCVPACLTFGRNEKKSYKVSFTWNLNRETRGHAKPGIHIAERALNT